MAQRQTTACWQLPTGAFAVTCAGVGAEMAAGERVAWHAPSRLYYLPACASLLPMSVRDDLV